MSSDRFLKTCELLEIAREFALAGKNEGYSIYDIQKDYKLKKLTAQRMKDAIDRLFYLEEVEHSCRRRPTETGRQQNRKYWYMPDIDGLKLLTKITPRDISLLESCRDFIQSNKRVNTEPSFGAIVDKLKLLTKGAINDTDAEIMLESQGWAIRQMPKMKYTPEVLKQIFDAILATKTIEFTYKKKKDITKKYRVHPYGLFYGTQINLIAHDEEDIGEFQNRKKHFNISRMTDITVLDEYFDLDEDFSLKEHLKIQFGSYHDERNIVDVKLKFDKSVAEDVLNYSIHPTQKMEQLDTGDVIVSFSACGTREMCWHIFTWGNKCQILEPQSLKDEYKQYLEDAMNTIK